MSLLEFVWTSFDLLVAFSMWMFAEDVISIGQLRRWFGWYLDLSLESPVIHVRMWYAVEYMSLARGLVAAANRSAR